MTVPHPVASRSPDRTDVCGAGRGTLPQREKVTDRVFDRQIGLIRGGTRPTAPVHDGKCGANALCATIVGNWREPSGESRLRGESAKTTPGTRIRPILWPAHESNRADGGCFDVAVSCVLLRQEGLSGPWKWRKLLLSTVSLQGGSDGTPR